MSDGLYLTRSLAYASGYYFGKTGAVQLRYVRAENLDDFITPDFKNRTFKTDASGFENAQ